MNKKGTKKYQNGGKNKLSKSELDLYNKYKAYVGSDIYLNRLKNFRPLQDAELEQYISLDRLRRSGSPTISPVSLPNQIQGWYENPSVIDGIGKIILSPKRDNYTYVHEMDHLNRSGGDRYNNAELSLLRGMNRSDSKLSKDQLDYLQDPRESGAKLSNLRSAAVELGIHQEFGEEFTEEQLQNLLEKVKENKSFKFIEAYNPKYLLQALNTIADRGERQVVPIAQNGGGYSWSNPSEGAATVTTPTRSQQMRSERKDLLDNEYKRRHTITEHEKFKSIPRDTINEIIPPKGLELDDQSLKKIFLLEPRTRSLISDKLRDYSEEEEEKFGKEFIDLYKSGKYDEAIKLAGLSEEDFSKFKDKMIPIVLLANELGVEEVRPTDSNIFKSIIGNTPMFDFNNQVVYANFPHQVVLELAHAKQKKEGENIYSMYFNDWLKTPFFSRQGYRRLYNTPNSFENRAHKIIEPQIRSALSRMDSLLIGEYKNGGSPQNNTMKKNKISKGLNKYQQGGKNDRDMLAASLEALNIPQKELMNILFGERKSPSELLTGDELGSKLMGRENYGLLADLLLDPLNLIPLSKAKYLLGFKGEKQKQKLSNLSKIGNALWAADKVNDIQTATTSDAVYPYTQSFLKPFQQGGNTVQSKSPRTGSRKNKNGSESTHLMTYTSADGKYYAYPTLFQKPDGTWYELSDDNNWAAFEEAKRLGEVYEFDTEEEAKKFAAGSWKNTPKMQQGGNPNYDISQFLGGLDTQFTDFMSQNPIFANATQKPKVLSENEWRKQNGYPTVFMPWQGGREQEAREGYMAYVQGQKQGYESNLEAMKIAQPLGKALFQLNELNETADLERTLGQKRDAYTLDDEVPQMAFKGYFQQGGGLNLNLTPRVEQNDKEEEMIDGIIEMLRQIEDLNNRKRVAVQKLQELQKEGIEIDPEDFLEDVMSEEYEEEESEDMEMEEEGQEEESMKYGGQPKGTNGQVKRSWREGKKLAVNIAKNGGDMNQQTLGYKDNSPYKNLPYQDFFTNTLTMNGVSRPILALPDRGQPRVMLPNSGIYSFPLANQVREIPLAQDGLRPTRQDSLLLYNNSVSIQKFLEKNKKYKLLQESHAKNSDIESIFNNFNPKELNYIRNDYDGTVKITDRNKRINNNLIQLADISEGIPGKAFNEKMPPLLIHRNILPNNWNTYYNEEIYDSVDVPYYNTAFTIPEDLIHRLTPEQREQREKYKQSPAYFKALQRQGILQPRPKINVNSLPTEITELPTEQPQINLELSGRIRPGFLAKGEIKQASPSIPNVDIIFKRVGNQNIPVALQNQLGQRIPYNESERGEVDLRAFQYPGSFQQGGQINKYQNGSQPTYEEYVYNLPPKQKEEYATELLSYMQEIGEDKMKKFAPKEYSFLIDYMANQVQSDPDKKPDYDVEAPRLPEIEKRGERIYPGYIQMLRNAADENRGLNLELSTSEEYEYMRRIDEINKKILDSLSRTPKRSTPQYSRMNDGLRQILNLTGKVNPFSQLPNDYYMQGGSVKPSIITDSDSHNKKKGPGANYPKKGPMGPKGYNYSTGRRDVQDYTVFNEYIPTENLIPIQTEKDELIVLPTGDISPVMATKRHSRMREDEVTDVTPEGSYILSAHGDVRIYKDEASSVITELGIKPYRLGYGQEKPTEKTLGDFMHKSKMSPAEIGAKVMKQFPVWKTNNIFEAAANTENKVNRKPYLEGLIQLSELDRYRKGLIQPDQMKNGGSVMRRDFLPKAQTGLEVMLIGTALNSLLGMAGSQQQAADARRAYRDVTGIVNQSTGTQANLLGIGAGMGIAGTLAQDPTVDYVQLDPSYIRQMEYRTPMALRDSMANRAYANRPDYMRVAPNFAAGVGAEQAAYAAALKQGYDAEMSIFDRDRAARNQYLTAMQGYQDKNEENRIVALNAMRLNRNQMTGNVGDKAQGLFDSRAILEANRAQSLVGARLGQLANQQQLTKSMTQGTQSLVNAGTLAYQNYLQSRPPITIPSTENRTFNLTQPTFNSLYTPTGYNFNNSSTWGGNNTNPYNFFNTSTWPR